MTTTLYSLALEELQLVQKEHNYGNQGEMLKLQVLCFDLRCNIRWYYLDEAMARETIWSKIREDEPVMNLLMHMSMDWLSRFNSQLFMHNFSYIDFMNRHIGDVYAFLVAAHSEDSSQQKRSNQKRSDDVLPHIEIADNEFLEKIPTTNNVYDLLLTNTWLYVLMLLCRHYQEIFKPVAQI